MSDEPKTDNDKIETLARLLKDVQLGMLTTVAEDGSLHSRPMAYRSPEEGFDGTLYFFTRANSPKVDEVQREERVNVSFADPKEQNYVSVSGTAQLSFDKAKMKELWNPLFKTWFPEGLDDPDIALLVVTAEQAEYWDAPNSTALHLYGVVKAALTGTPPSGGEHEKIELLPGAVSTAGGS